MKTLSQIVLILFILFLSGCSGEPNPLDVHQKIRDMKGPESKYTKIENPFYIFDDSIVWEEEKMSLNELELKWKKLEAENKFLKVIIIPQKNLKIERMVNILDLARRIGVEVAIEADRD